jgi:ribose transport system ATP-binding protein
LKSVTTELGHRDIDLYVRAGEVVGLYGLVGAGRSELAKAVIGSHRVITGGEVLIDGKRTSIGGVLEALRKWRIGYVSEDRKGEGLILTHSVARNTAITIWHAIAGRVGLISGQREDSAIRPYVERLDVKVTSLAQTVGNLSGGNQQKVSVAKWLAADTRILIMDEPTAGVDVRTKGYLHQLVWELADSGVAVLLITSDLSEMIQLADRIYVMNDYRVVEELTNSREYDLMSSSIMNAIQIDNDRVSVPKPAVALA